MNERERRYLRLHYAGSIAWLLGLIAVVVNVWLMRSASSEPLVWIVAAVLVVVGDLLANSFREEFPAEDVVLNVKTGSLIATAVAIGGFFWLTLVMPTTSDTGQTAIEFFAAIERNDLDGAYEMLSDEAKQRIPRDEFEQRLPPGYRTQTGASVDAIRGSVGTVAGQSACVDGTLNVPAGESVHFSIGLVTDEDHVAKINTLLLDHSCTFR